jgi:hypothetical protein
MKKTLIIAIPAGAILLSMVRLHATAQRENEQSGKDGLKTFMQLKLEHTKGIVEGLATENFEKIASSAQSLNALSLQSSWNTFTTIEYQEHSSDFRRAIHLITKASHDQNLDRAALGYVSLTVQCIECHRYMRQKSAEAIPGNK